MSPLVKTVKENGYEVLYMTDHVDEAAAGSVDSFDEKKLVDLGKDGVNVLKTEGLFTDLQSLILASLPDLTNVETSEIRRRCGCGLRLLRRDGEVEKLFNPMRPRRRRTCTSMLSCVSC